MESFPPHPYPNQIPSFLPSFCSLRSLSLSLPAFSNHSSLLLLLLLLPPATRSPTIPFPFPAQFNFSKQIRSLCKNPKNLEKRATSIAVLNSTRITSKFSGACF
ncbi:hypothetical protein L6452_09019 [Arctium lappa]|uniref:Uncharacterized protein n=1 Tax=Arctium lappa TaxID=4217 RepID=A0ACB9DIW5_ARCLA|nr:hypothetical protein L6452_09019 [Arctium lappa]